MAACRQFAEIIAKFCGDVLFSTEESQDTALNSIFQKATQEQRTGIRNFFRKFILWIKEKLGKTSYTEQLQMLEDKWINLIKNSEATEETGAVKYDINGKSSKLVDIYTEEQYNNYGWTTANNVWSTAERETIFSRYADFKHNKDKYPITRFGEVVINSSEHPNIIAYVKGDIKNPKVTKIIRINAQNELLSEISKEILHNERRQISLPNENVIDLFGEEILTNSKRKDYASFQEYKTRRQRSNSQKSNSDNKQLKNGSGNLQSNKENDRADGLTPAFSIPESKKEFSISPENIRYNQERYVNWLLNTQYKLNVKEDAVNKFAKELKRISALDNGTAKQKAEARELLDELSKKMADEYNVPLIPEAQELLRYIRNTKFSLTETQKQEARDKYGSDLFQNKKSAICFLHTAEKYVTLSNFYCKIKYLLGKFLCIAGNGEGKFNILNFRNSL